MIACVLKTVAGQCTFVAVCADMPLHLPCNIQFQHELAASCVSASLAPLLRAQRPLAPRPYEHLLCFPVHFTCLPVQQVCSQAHCPRASSPLAVQEHPCCVLSSSLTSAFCQQ